MGRWEDGKMDMQSILPLLERKLRIATEEFNRPDLRIFAPPPGADRAQEWVPASTVS